MNTKKSNKIRQVLFASLAVSEGIGSRLIMKAFFCRKNVIMTEAMRVKLA